MSIQRLLYLGSMQLPEDCGRNPWGSEALNVTQLTLMRAFRARGVNRIIGISFPGSSSWHNSHRIKRGKRSMLESGVEVWELPFLAFGPLQPLSQFFSCLAHLISMKRPDALLISNPITRIAVPALIMARLWQIPAVVIASDLSPGESAPNLLRKLQQFLQLNVARFAPGVIVFSNHLGREIRPTRPWKRMIRPPAEDLLGLTTPFNPDANSRIAYYAGTMAEVAGADLFLRVTRYIHDRSYRFWFSGRGPLDSVIHAAASQDDRITHWGFVSREKYRELLRQANVLINPRPSRLPENRYNFPSKLMEYMVAGRPIISTATSDITEYYADAIVLLDDETPERLAELIQQVCEMPAAEQLALGQRAQQHVENETWEAQAQLILDFMETLRS